MAILIDSFVLDDLCHDWIDGYKPKKNIGSNIKAQILDVMYSNNLLDKVLYEPTASNDELEVKVKKPLKGKLEGFPKGVQKPDFSEGLTKTYYRDPLVKSWILQQANGKCENCNSNGPFISNLGIPFLEIHHVNHLSQGGSDTTDNAVALCPNCHRALHYANNKVESIEVLYTKIPRLKKQ